ncbi:hypothetical protein [Virgibacillus sp. L01]
MKIKCDIILINAVRPIEDIFSHLAFNDFTALMLVTLLVTLPCMASVVN